MDAVTVFGRSGTEPAEASIDTLEIINREATSGSPLRLYFGQREPCFEEASDERAAIRDENCITPPPRKENEAGHHRGTTGGRRARYAHPTDMPKSIGPRQRQQTAQKDGGNTPRRNVSLVEIEKSVSSAKALK